MNRPTGCLRSYRVALGLVPEGNKERRPAISDPREGSYRPPDPAAMRTSVDYFSFVDQIFPIRTTKTTRIFATCAAQKPPGCPAGSINGAWGPPPTNAQAHPPPELLLTPASDWTDGVHSPFFQFDMVEFWAAEATTNMGYECPS